MQSNQSKVKMNQYRLKRILFPHNNQIYSYSKFVPTQQQMPDPRKKAKRQRYLKRKANPSLLIPHSDQSSSDGSQIYADDSFSDEEQSSTSTLNRAGKFEFDSNSQLYRHNPNNPIRQFYESSTIQEQHMIPIKNNQNKVEMKIQLQNNNNQYEGNQQIAKLQLLYEFITVAPTSYRYNCTPQVLDLILRKDYIQNHTYQEIKKHMQALRIPQEIINKSIIYLRHGDLQPYGDFQYISQAQEWDLEKKIKQLISQQKQ